MGGYWEVEVEVVGAVGASRAAVCVVVARARAGRGRVKRFGHDKVFHCECTRPASAINKIKRITNLNHLTTRQRRCRFHGKLADNRAAPSML